MSGIAVLPTSSSGAGSKPKMLRILLVDDKPGTAARLKGQLESQGHDVVGLASDGRQALESIGTLNPNLVIIDLRLVHGDAIDAARTIVASRPLPIILLIGHDAAEFVMRAREAGIMASLVTPTDARRLVAAIDLALTRFGEFQAIRRETGGLEEAFVVRNEIEHAKRVLMRYLRVSEPEAFRWLWRSRTIAPNLRELTEAILRSEMLLKDGNLVRSLQSIVPAIHRGLSRSDGLQPGCFPTVRGV